MRKYILLWLFFISFLSITSLNAQERIIKLAVDKYLSPYVYVQNKNMDGLLIDYFNLIAKNLDYEISYVPFIPMEKKIKDIDILISTQDRYNLSFRYRFDYIFPKQTGIKIFFKEQKLRDDFANTLNKLELNGKLDEVFNNYFQKVFVENKQLKSLLSSIVARYIFTNELPELNRVVSLIGSLPYIKKLEVFDNSDRLLAASSNLDFKDYLIQDSFHFILNIPQKVGYIKLYYDKKMLLKDFTPSLSFFRNLKSYPYIKQIYRKFEHLDSKRRFIIQNKFIKNNPIIKFSQIDWKPLTIVENSSYSGLFADYIRIVEQKSGLKFNFIPSLKFNDSISEFKSGKLDIIPIISGPNVNRDFGLISDPIIKFSYAVVSTSQAEFVNDLEYLNFKKIALPKEHTSNIYIKNRYPNIEIVQTQNIEEAMFMVSKGEVYATIEAMPVSIYHIKNSYPDLKIVGISQDKFTLNFLVQDNKPELLSIINKVLDTISYKQRENIEDKWVKIEVSKEIDFTSFYMMIAFFFFVILIFLFFYSKLSNAQEQLVLKSKDLKEQKEIFETLFNDSTDSILLMKDGKFIDCNSSAVKFLGYKRKDDFLNLHPYEVSPSKQPDGVSSKQKELLKNEECLNNGSSRFEWVHRKSNGEEIWVDVLLTKIVIYNEDVIHVVWRDITDKKNLEKQVEKRTQELEKSNKELEVSFESLKKTQDQLVTSEKMASLGGLVAGVAHEVNTPVGIGLTGITHLLEITKDLKDKYQEEKMSQEDFEEYLNTIEDVSTLINSNLERAANLVKSFKKVAVDQTSEIKRNFDLEEYINEVLSSIYNITKKTKIEIIILSNNKIVINSFPGAISQIITNLVMNSFIHAYEKDEKGIIKIELIKNEDEIEIIYSDDGKGILEENLPKIFDPFFTTSREQGGSGLGLNIIYNIVTTTLNGTITCKSEVGHGVKFIIKFKSS